MGTIKSLILKSVEMNADGTFHQVGMCYQPSSYKK